MTDLAVNSGEILFVKSVKDGIPNRDPLNDSDARRIFGEEDGRISLSDVSIKRDVRDYILARYPDGGPDHRNHVFVRKQFKDDGKTLLGRGSLAEEIKKQSGIDSNDMKEVLCRAAVDVRLFGAVYSVKKEKGNFQLTGPVQFGWAHSLHPVETVYVQGTVVMPSQDAKNVGGEEREGGGSEGRSGGATQGTIWTTYLVPFAIFAMPGVVNASIAKETGMSQDDIELLLEALWKGTLHRQARGRGIQQPLLLLHVEYNDPFFRIGYLEDCLRLEPGPDEWRRGNRPTSLDGVKLDVTRLVDRINSYASKVARVRFWIDPQLQLIGALPWEKQEWQ